MYSGRFGFLQSRQPGRATLGHVKKPESDSAGDLHCLSYQKD